MRGGNKLFRGKERVGICIFHFSYSQVAGEVYKLYYENTGNSKKQFISSVALLFMYVRTRDVPAA